MNLLSDSLLQYDELEAAFFVVLKEKNLSWFGTLITPAARDDSTPLLSPSRKPYRDLILANTISVFDFRIYLLARQCELLARMQRLPDVSRRCVSFLGAFGRRLYEVQVRDRALPLVLLRWIIGISISKFYRVLDVFICVKCCRPMQFMGARIFSGQGSTGNHQCWQRGTTRVRAYSGLSRLLPTLNFWLNLNFSLMLLAFNANFFHTSRPFPMPYLRRTSPRPHPCQVQNSATKNSSKLSRTDPHSMICISVLPIAPSTCTSKLDDGSLPLSSMAALLRSTCKNSFALPQAPMSICFRHRGRLDNALATYTSLPAHYSPHKWTSLEGLMLSFALDTHKVLEKPRDSEWLHILISFLSAYTSHGKELLLSEDDGRAYIDGLVSMMRIAANDLQQGIVFTAF